MTTLPRRVGTALALTAMAVLTLGGCAQDPDPKDPSTAEQPADDDAEATEIDPAPADGEDGADDADDAETGTVEDDDVASSTAADPESAYHVEAFGDDANTFSAQELTEFISVRMETPGEIDCENGIEAGGWASCNVSFETEDGMELHPLVNEGGKIEAGIVRSVHDRYVMILRAPANGAPAFDSAVDLNGTYVHSYLTNVGGQVEGLATDQVAGGIEQGIIAVEVTDGDYTFDPEATCTDEGEAVYKCAVSATKPADADGNWLGKAHPSLFADSVVVVFQPMSMG